MPVESAPVDIVNEALALLYQPPVTSLIDSNVPAASSALRIFDARRRYWLRAMLWNFARWRAMCPLVQNATPAFDFNNFYSLPADYMSLAQLGPDWRRFDPLWYDIQGPYICLNPSCPPQNNGVWNSLEIKYFRDVPDVTQWDPLFRQVMVFDIAMMLCMPVVANPQMLKQLSEMFALTLKDAQAANHRDRKVIVTERDPIGNARRAASGIWNLNVDPIAWGSEDDS